MLRLCSESSRSYPGRSALHALSIFYNKSRHGPYRVTKVQASPAVADGGETRTFVYTVNPNGGVVYRRAVEVNAHSVFQPCWIE